MVIGSLGSGFTDSPARRGLPTTIEAHLLPAQPAPLYGLDPFGSFATPKAAD